MSRGALQQCYSIAFCFLLFGIVYKCNHCRMRNVSQWDLPPGSHCWVTFLVICHKVKSWPGGPIFKWVADIWLKTGWQDNNPNAKWWTVEVRAVNEWGLCSGWFRVDLLKCYEPCYWRTAGYFKIFRGPVISIKTWGYFAYLRRWLEKNRHNDILISVQLLDNFQVVVTQVTPDFLSCVENM